MILNPTLHALAVVSLVWLGAMPANARAQSAEKPPNIISLSKPDAGDTQILFHGVAGPFQLQSRKSLDTNAPWSDIPAAKIAQVQPGLFLATFPMGLETSAFYRVMSAGETIAEIKGWTVLVQVSAPANQLYFVTGEAPVVTVTILDNFAQGVGLGELSSLNLYMDGPQDPKLTVTALKLLNATADRSKRPHHYIDLKTDPNVRASAHTFTYPLQPVADEAPGTYTVCVRAVLGTDALQQVMKYVDVQIGTATVETPVVTKVSCTPCHLGPVSGKIYMHHIDPSGTSLGSWSLDAEPVRSCKECHNNDGYAAYNDASAPGGKVSDAIVLRVHGVHMGEGLSYDFNTNATTGNFRDYTHVAFPADVRNCNVCHKDDRYKTEPSRSACASCHDNTWFGAKTAVPPGMEMHLGSTQADDSKCSICHDPDTITDYHRIDPVPFKQVVKLELTPPGNGKYYAAGDAPKLTIKITEAATGKPINPATIVEPQASTNITATEWRRANLYVSGPREQTVPVLTTAAANPDPTKSTLNNELRVLKDPTKADPRITRTEDAIIYQLDDVSNLVAGTYTVFVDVTPYTVPGGWGLLNFQVGSTNIEPLVAGNCIDCHGDTRIHTNSRYATFTPDICKSCHDYQHQMPGKTSWSSSQYGFGVAPLVRRIHGIHFGNYLDKPKEVQTEDFSHVIFPQDVRNCTKCHSESTSWNEKPSRLACLACHDTDAALFHGALMTYDPTPLDPWRGDEVETCEVCHGKDSQFSARAVHAIANPFVPPYPRDAR